MKKYALIILALAALCLYPVFMGPYFISMALLIFMYMSLAGSWNIISGFVGYVSLGHAVFFGVGAYLAALQITNFGTHWLPASLLAGVGTSLLAVPVGALCLRLRGPFFAIFMLGLNELMAILASVYDNITGGAEGLSLPILRQIIPLYFAMGLTALSVFLVMRWLESSRFGLRLLSIREDETAADTLGTNTTLYKLIAFIMSAFFPGVVGGIYARYITYIDPETVFNILFSVQMVLMCILGGRGTAWGPVIGATALYLILEFTWANFPHFHKLASGTLIVLIILYAPRGIMGFIYGRGLAQLRPSFKN